MRWSTMADIAYAILIAHVAIYHLWLYRRRPQDASNFWFFIVCVSALLFAGAQGLYYEFDRHPYAAYFNRLPLLTAAWVVITLICYGRSFEGVSRRFALGSAAAAAALLPITVFTPWVLTDVPFTVQSFAYDTPLVIHRWGEFGSLLGIVMLLSLFDVVASIWRRLRAGDRGARPLLWAFAVLFLAGVNDLLFSGGAISTMFLSDVGFVALVVGITASHGMRFVELHETVERQSARLADDVAARTAELRGAVARLEEVTEEQRLLLENTGDFLYRRSLMGRIEYISSSVERISGYTPEEISAAPWRAPEEYLKAFLTEDWSSRLAAKIADGPNNPLNWRRPFLVEIRHKNGGPVMLEINERPYLEDGTLQGAIGVGRDVTERVAVEAEARELSSRYRAFFEQCPVPVFIIDGASLRFVDFNSRTCELLGVEPEELRSLRIFDVAAILTREQFERAASRSRLGDHHDFDGRFRARGGGERHVRVSSRTVELSGRLVHQVVVVDLTERKRAEERRLRLETRMLQAQKFESLGVLAGGIAHDFNNILAAILGNIELARLDAGPNEALRVSLEQAELAARRGAELIELMLAYAGKGHIQDRRINFGSLIGDMERLLQVTLAKRAKLQYDFCEEPAEVVADVNQIRQIVMNLVTNAAEAIGEEAGTIDVRTRVIDHPGGAPAGSDAAEPLRPGRYVLLEVQDDGCGMQVATRERIFEPFFSTKFTGRGLGMAAVLGIVRSHGGAIAVESFPGRGTTVRVLLPSAGAADPNAESTEPVAAAGAEETANGVPPT